MPEVMNPEVVITPEQRDWANAILRVTGGTGESEGKEESSQDDFAKDFKIKTKDAYGAGLKGGSILQDGRNLPGSFVAALTKGAPMISKEDWLKTLEGRKPTQAEIEDLVKNKGTIVATLKEAKEKRDLMEALVTVEKLLADAKAANKDCDLTEYGAGVIPIASLSPVLGNIRNQIATLKPESDRLDNESGKALLILDSPENNPEHLEVAEGLGDLAALEKKFAEGNIDEKDFIKAKADLLFGLEAVVFKWVDRRTHQNLPASNDIVALADMIQRVHHEMMSVVVEKGLPLPLSQENESRLSDKEKKEIQDTWKNLVDSKSTAPKEGSRLSIKEPGVDGKLIKTVAEGKEFRLEMLSHVSRLMQSSAGRDLLGSLNKGEKTVSFAPKSSPCCITPSNMGFGGKPTDCTVGMMVGQKDSTRSYSTKLGGALFASVPVTLGHELVHALHGTRGKMMHKELPPEDALWNNKEEYNTIWKGKLSEQTLRHQYGLSAERFAHIIPPIKDGVYQAVVDNIEVAEEINSRNREMIDQMLTVRKFDPKKIPDKLKTKLADSSLKGPIPPGWNIYQLTFEQLEEILKDPTLDAKLHEFSWPPYGLNRARMEEIYTTKEHHVRSPKGLRMRALGGVDALDGFADFKLKTGIDLGTAKGTTWEDKLEALEAANVIIVDLATTHPEKQIKTAAAGKSRLQKRLPKVTKVFEAFAKRLADHGGEAALDEIADYNKEVGNKQLTVDRKDLFTQVNTLDAALQQQTLDVKYLPSSIKTPALSSGTTGARLKATAELWKTSKEEFEQLGGMSARYPAISYDSLLGRKLNLLGQTDLFSSLITLRLAKADLSKLKSETTYGPLKSAITGANLLSDLTEVNRIWKELQVEFASYGGSAGHQGIPVIGKLIGVNLDAKATGLPDQIAECKAASEALEKYAAENKEEEIQNIGKSKGTLAAKAAQIEKVLQRKEANKNLVASRGAKNQEIETQGTEMVAAFETSKVSKEIENVDPDGTDSKVVTDAYATLTRYMNALPMAIPSLLPAIDDLEMKAQAYLNNPNHQDPWIPVRKRRRALCEQLVTTAREARNKYNAVQEKAREAIADAKELAKNPDDIDLSAVEGFTDLLQNPYLDVEVQRELTDAAIALTTLVDEARIKRETL